VCRALKWIWTGVEVASEYQGEPKLEESESEFHGVQALGVLKWIWTDGAGSTS
jgi:hypothetical protein